MAGGIMSGKEKGPDGPGPLAGSYGQGGRSTVVAGPMEKYTQSGPGEQQLIAAEPARLFLRRRAHDDVVEGVPCREHRATRRRPVHVEAVVAHRTMDVESLVLLVLLQ